MKDENILTAFVFGVGLFFGIAFGYAVKEDHWQQEIVDKGFAEWQIVTGTKELEFKWKENK